MKHSSKLVSTIGLVLASTGSFALESHNGKLDAVSGAGIATASYSTGALINPALAASYNASDDFDIKINGGVLGSDKDEMIDNADDLDQVLDRIDSSISITQSDVDEAVALLQALDESVLTINAGGNFSLAIPNKYLSAVLYGNVSAELAGGVIVDDADLALLQTSVSGTLDTDTLASTVTLRGLAVQEVGLALAKSFPMKNDAAIMIGFTPKYQSVETYDYVVSAGSYEDDEFDSEQYSTDDSFFNFDVGAVYASGNFRLAASLKNALEQEITTVEGNVAQLEPLVTLGAGYTNDWFTAELDVDANAIELFSVGDDVQFARAGIEIDGWDWVQLRLGYRHDLKGTMEDTASLGIGFSPFGVVNVDVAAIAGDNDTLGASVQLGFSF